MPNELTQDGSFNIGVQNVTNSTINVTQVLGKSLEYKDLLNQLQTQQKLFSRTPENETQERLEISQTIAQLESIIEQFKKDVTQLAAEFDRIEINTDRMRRAKEHFEKGEIAAARAVFDSERESMQDENDRLVRKKELYEKDVLPQLKNSSDEYYLRALLERTAYENPNWLEDTCDYFERSIKVFATEDNVFQYALFLQNHNFFDQAEVYYQKYLDDFAKSNQSKRAMTLINLGLLHSTQNSLIQAENKYEEALAIYQQISIANHNYLPQIAALLINFANLHQAKNELAQAETKYFEAITIYRKLVTRSPPLYESELATALNNFANLLVAMNAITNIEEIYQEALIIRRRLAILNPSIHLPDLAMTLNNLANWNSIKIEWVQAEANYLEALSIRRNLAAINPAAFLPDMAMTLNNLGALYQDQNSPPQSESKYLEALAIYRQLMFINKSAYLPEMASTLQNLAALHQKGKELVKAENEYTEALAIRRELATVTPTAYRPKLAMTLINFAIYYIESVPNRERSISYLLEAVMILLPIVEAVPFTQRYLQTAIRVLQEGWGLSEEEIQQMLDEK